MAIGGFSDEIEHLNWRWNNRYNLLILHKYKNLPSLLFNKPCIVKYSSVDLYDKSFFKFIAQYLCLGYAAAGYFSNNSGDSLSELNLRYQWIFHQIFSWSIFKNIDNFNPMVMSSGLVLLGSMPNYKFTQGREALELHRFPCFFFCHAKHVNQHYIYLDHTFAIYFFFHIIEVSDMSVLEKMLEEIARLTNFSPDQVCTIPVTFSGFTLLLIIYSNSWDNAEINLAVFYFIAHSNLWTCCRVK